MGLIYIIQEIQQKKNFQSWCTLKKIFLNHFWNQIIRKYPGRFQHVFVSEFLKMFLEDNNISYKINSQIIHNYIDAKIFQYVERANFLEDS